MSDNRDLEADLAILTCIPFDPNDANMISDIVAPHALRRAIAAEKRVRELEDELIKELKSTDRHQCLIITRERINQMNEGYFPRVPQYPCPYCLYSNSDLEKLRFHIKFHGPTEVRAAAVKYFLGG